MSVAKESKGETVMVENTNETISKDEANLDWLASQATEEEQNLTLIQGLKKYPKACFWSVALSSAIIMEGILAIFALLELLADRGRLRHRPHLLSFRTTRFPESIWRLRRCHW